MSGVTNEEAEPGRPKDDRDAESTSSAVAAPEEAAEEPTPDNEARAATDEPDQPQPDEGPAERGVKEVARHGGGAGQALRRYWPVAVLAVTTVVLAVGIAIALRNTSGKPKRPASPPPLELVTVNDRDAGFTIKHPKGWQRMSVPPGADDLRLVLRVGGPGGEDDGMWVRVIPPDRVNQKFSEFTADIAAITGGMACGAEGSRCLQQKEVNIGGLIGVQYIYLTPKTESGQTNVHYQYFLRPGKDQGKLYVLVFETQPNEDLTRLAPLFDQVLFSFQVTEPAPAPGAAPSTTPTSAAPAP